jgi:hypothetical protein
MASCIGPSCVKLLSSCRVLRHWCLSATGHHPGCHVHEAMQLFQGVPTSHICACQGNLPEHCKSSC